MSLDDEISYTIGKTRRGKIYIEASLPGGAEHRLPYQSFDTVEQAQKWVEAYEAKRAKQRARYAREKPIRF